MLAALLVVVAVVIGGIYALQSSTPPRVSPENLSALEQAMRNVPARDYPGSDAPGLPRPAGAMRSYYLRAGTVTTVIYTKRSAIPDVRAGLEPALKEAGWRPVTAGGPTPAATLYGPWSAVLSNGRQVVQLSAFQNNDVTAVTYVIQETP
jgi:hypothetical protein